jgi:hypothetical protein
MLDDRDGYGAIHRIPRRYGGSRREERRRDHLATLVWNLLRASVSGVSIAATEATPVPAKTSRRKPEPKVVVVNFSLGDRTYQIDPERQKVYQRFVEIESARASTIYSMWRSQNLRP